MILLPYHDFPTILNTFLETVELAYICTLGRQTHDHYVSLLIRHQNAILEHNRRIFMTVEDSLPLLNREDKVREWIHLHRGLYVRKPRQPIKVGSFVDAKDYLSAWCTGTVTNIRYIPRNSPPEPPPALANFNPINIRLERQSFYQSFEFEESDQESDRESVDSDVDEDYFIIQYYVHFMGWKKGWCEWVREPDIRPFATKTLNPLSTPPLSLGVKQWVFRKKNDKWNTEIIVPMVTTPEEFMPITRETAFLLTGYNHHLKN